MLSGDLVKVKVLTSMAGVDSSFQRGETASFPRADAERLQAAGAVKILGADPHQAPKETAMRRGAPEKAVR